MREVGGRDYFEALMAAFDEVKDEHIAVYGPDNHLRLTGLHETQSIDTFSYGVADRGASVRVPHSFVNDGYRGYLEDRRPNPQGDPYRIAGRILRDDRLRSTGGIRRHARRRACGELERERRRPPRATPPHRSRRGTLSGMPGGGARSRISWLRRATVQGAASRVSTIHRAASRRIQAGRGS